MKAVVYLVIAFLLGACSRDSELQQSIFIPDPVYSDLPIYSEQGYNTFGAYYDRQPFTSTSPSVPFKAISTQNKTEFVFTGVLGAFNAYSGSATPFSMTLTIANSNPSAFVDLVSWNGVTMDLTDPRYSLSITDESSTYFPQVLNGSFTVNRARMVYVDDQLQEVTLSGVFNFQLIVNQIPVTMSNGRFDMGVDSDNFFSY
jgi:hypothetical protein